MAGDRLRYLPDRHRRLVLRLLMAGPGRLVRVDGERLRRLPEPAIIALNHSTTVEAVAVPAALVYHRHGRLVHFVTDWMYVHLPLVGSLVRLIEPVPVFTKRARFGLRESFRCAQHRSPIERCVDLLAAGGTVGIYPEGTRNPDPRRLLRGRAGLGAVALASRAPVVPLGVRFPRAGCSGRRLPRIGRMEIAIGDPRDFAMECDAFDRAAGRRRERAQLVREVVDRVMNDIAALCGKTYTFEPPL